MKKNNQIYMFFVLTVLSQPLYAMQKSNDTFKSKQSAASAWNTVVDTNGNTLLHGLIADFYTEQDKLAFYVYTYKKAVLEGANPLIPNNNGSTALCYLKKCFASKLFKAIDADNRLQLHQLLSSAPELCLDAIHGLKETPLQYAIKRNNLYAQACISHCIDKGECPKNYCELLETTTQLL